MKQKIKKYITILPLVVTLMFSSSCSNDFLDVADPTVLDTKIYPSSMAHFELMINDIYGRLREGMYSQNFRTFALISKNNDTGYNGAGFNEFCLNNLHAGHGELNNLWNNAYNAIAKCNDFLAKLDEFKATSSLTAAQEARTKTMVAEVRYLRAFNYFNLINMFGEDPILTEADKSKMGVPLRTELPKTIKDAPMARSTQGEVYDFIISELEAALPPLLGIGRINNQQPRVDEWTVKSLLAKSYVFTLQWNKAVPVLKDIIDKSGKELVSYTILRSMYNTHNEFNRESIWEVNYTVDAQSSSTSAGTGNFYNRYTSVTFRVGNSEVVNGYSNHFVHDENIPRFGFDDSKWGYLTTTLFPLSNPPNLNSGVVNADYKAYSLKVRQDKSVDPRLYVSAMQPFIDSINRNDGNGWCLILKGRQESYVSSNMRSWANRKYNVLDYVFSNSIGSGNNFYVFRLADIYLLYAESLIKSGGDQALALEYINKVHRRAYDQPVNTPSPYDYKSLTDRTATLDPNDHLANDVLKYERWAELFMEGGWWFDVRRWDIGEQEVKYFKKTNPGTLVFNRKGFYAWPIPTAEMNANSLMVQNP